MTETETIKAAVEIVVTHPRKDNEITKAAETFLTALFTKATEAVNAGAK